MVSIKVEANWTAQNNTYELEDSATVEDLLVLISIDFQIELDEQSITFSNNLKAGVKTTFSSQDSKVVLSSILADPAVVTNGTVGKTTQAAVTTATTSNSDNLSTLRQKIADLFNTNSNNANDNNNNNSPAVLNRRVADLFNSSSGGGGGTTQNANHFSSLAGKGLEDEEIQKQIYERIRQEVILKSFYKCIEIMPESLTSVCMLYIKIKLQEYSDEEINTNNRGRPSGSGKFIYAFVDSGAQNSFMSRKTAEENNLSKYIDERFAGTAVGVGTQAILGKIHLVDMLLYPDGAGDEVESEDNYFMMPFSFSVLENQPIDIIIGLDQLRSHNIIINIPANCLMIRKDLFGGAGGASGGGGGSFDDYVRIPFVPEHQLPEECRPKHRSIFAERKDDENEEEGHKAKEAPAQPPQAHSKPLPAPTEPGAALTHEQEHTLHSFMQIGGVSNRDTAIALLEAADWDLNSAMDLLLSN